MKKGFTLVEVIGVLVLMAAIALITIPIIEKDIKEGKQSMYDSQIKSIEMSAQNWLTDNSPYKPSENQTITIMLSQLKQSGYVNPDIKNPLTKTLFPNDMLIEISNNAGIINYDVLEDTGTDSGEYNTDTPNIVLKGLVVSNVELKGTYTDLGVVAKAADGTIISNVLTEGTVDTNVAGSYKITYSVNYNGNTNSIARTVIVKDTEAPLISIPPGDLNIYDNEIVSFNFLTGVNVTDNSGSTITPIVTSNLSNIPTINKNYTITYTATDSSGNTTIENRKAIVLKSGNPVFIIGVSSVSIEKGTTYDLLKNVSATSADGYAATITCKINGVTCNTSTLDSGTYIVNYVATDRQGHTTSATRTLTVLVSCTYAIGQQFVYGYTGSVQTFTVSSKCTGVFKVEVWGAQGGYGQPGACGTGNSGGWANVLGGYGAYAVGTLNLTENTNLYITVGNQGASSTGSVPGGYNGGGTPNAGSGYVTGAGGGATHIASTTGLLSTFSSNQSAVFIAAAGGGGSGGCCANYGGSGGGINGVAGTKNNCTSDPNAINYTGPTGGTQSSAGSSSYSGAFGTGATGDSCAGGGGAGWYGGGGGSDCNSNGGGGGSSYIGGVSSNATYSITKAMYCYNCTTSAVANTLTYSTTNKSDTATSNYAKSGNGYARITYLGQ